MASDARKPAHVELVRAVTSDGVSLDGALSRPTFADSRTVLVCVHGAGGNFYGSPPFLGLTPLLAERGYSVLRVNTRGHDLAASSGSRRRQGAAYEIVDECRHDLLAWTQWARSAGFARVVLVGHSLGAIKAVYAMANQPLPDADLLIAISPARLSYRKFVESDRRREFLSTLAAAESAVAENAPERLLETRFPIPLLITAAAYVDKYGPTERYNILRYVKHLEIPALFVFGGLELLEGPAFAGLPEDLSQAAGGRSVTVTVIPGANHLYSGSLLPLAEVVDDWLAKVD
jgi:pimeloyl-ACP methyl ester carboxylesterase